LGNLFQIGKFPQSCLPSFLHEGVHHWCFQSPVGSTLALLQLRARRRAISWALESEGDLFDVVEDLIRYETALALMRPLAEGLALFAEFDVTPRRDSSLISLPMLWMYFCFTTQSKDELRNESGFSLYKLLHDVRLSQHYCQRKSNVLIQPVSCEHGGYLLGYMTVKNLWAYATSQCARFTDIELFLIYLRSFFYDDFGFVATLLSPQTAEIDSANAIASYFQERFMAFAQADFEADISMFESKVSKYKLGHRSDKLPRLNTDLGLYKLGQERLKQSVAELKNKKGKYKSIGDRLRLSDSWTLAQRDIMCIGSLDVSVRLPRQGWVVVSRNEQHILSGPALEGAPVGEGDGSLDFYISPAGGYRAVIVSLDQRIVSLQLLGTEDRAVQKQFKDYITNRAKVDATNEESRQLLEAITSNHVSSILLNHVREFNQEAPDQIYLQKALLHVPPQQLTRYFDMMKEDGLLPILNNETSLVKALAMIGLSTSLGLPRDHILNMLSMNGMDGQSTISELHRFGDKHNIPLILDEVEVLICLV